MQLKTKERHCFKENRQANLKKEKLCKMNLRGGLEVGKMV